MRKLLLLLSLIFVAPAYAADDQLQLTPCVSGCTTMKSKDVGSGKQAAQPVLSDATGTPLAGLPGWTPKMLNALTNTAVQIKASAGQLGYFSCSNTNVSQAYAQIYSLPSASVTVGTSTPVLSIPIPAGGTNGFSLPLSGIAVGGTGISVAATTTATGSTAPSTALDCNAGYN